MTQLSITQAGLNATEDAANNGFKLALKSFAFSEENIVTPSLTDASMQGIPVLTVPIESVEGLSNSAVRFTAIIPVNSPAKGQWSLGEVGLFLEDGTLFAHGAIPSKLIKTPEFGVRIKVVVTASRLGEVVNVTLNDSASLPSVPHVSSLIPPQQSNQNVVAVLDEVTSEEGHLNAGIAVKYGTGGTSWSFVGYKRQALGSPDSVSSQSVFTYNVQANGGFWLNDGETIIVQVLKGPGIGESRRATYLKAVNRFTTDKPFSSFSSHSLLAFWRDSSIALPARTVEIPSYYVLGAGTNDWQANSVDTSSGTLKFFRYSNSTKGNIFSTAPVIPVSAYGGTFLVWVDGVALKPSQFSYAGGTVLTTVAAVHSIDIIAFSFVLDAGSSVYLHEVQYEGDGVTVAFQLNAIPDSNLSTLVFVEGLLIPPANYVLSGTQVVFTNAPIGNISLVPVASYSEPGVRSILTFDLVVAKGGETSVDVSSNFGLKKDTLVTLNGKYLDKTHYSVNENTLSLVSTVLSVGDTVLVSNFTGSIGSVTSQPSGDNSGPNWIDPAGVSGTANELIPKIFTYIGDGVNTTFAIAQVPDEYHVLAFIHGSFQPPSSFYFSAHAIRFETPLPAGYPLDIICYTSVASPGSQAVCNYIDYVATAALTYSTHNISGTDNLIVSINGVYQHRKTWVFNNNTITFSQVDIGDHIEIWSYEWKPQIGFMSAVRQEQFTLTSETSYPLDNEIAVTEDTLLFVQGSQAHKENGAYSIAKLSGLSQVTLSQPPRLSERSIQVTLVEFISSVPKSRLLTRAEAAANYMPLRGTNVNFDSLTPRLKSILSCPIVKLLGIISGVAKPQGNAQNVNDIMLLNKLGFSPYSSQVDIDIIPILNWSSIGTGAILNVPVKFNLFKLLAESLKQLLGSSSFTINQIEVGKKYFIDKVQTSNIVYTPVPRAQIPGLPLGTPIEISAFYGVAEYLYSSTITQRGGQPLLLLCPITDMVWFTQNVSTVPMNWALPSLLHLRPSDNRLHTVSVTSTQDATYTNFVHTITDDTLGKTWTVKWSKLLTVTDLNAEYLFLTNKSELTTQNCPWWVKFLARMYASMGYNDNDCRKVMVIIGSPTPPSTQALGYFGGAIWAVSWQTFSYWAQHNRITGGPYPATAGYTANMQFALYLDNLNLTTGDADVTVSLTSGSVGYTMLDVSLLLKSVVLPVSFTVMPGIRVLPDGTIVPVIAADDIFSECCWDVGLVSGVPNCASEIPPIPIAQTTAYAQSTPAELSTSDTLTVTVNNSSIGATISWETTDAPNVTSTLGVTDASGFFSYSFIPLGIARTFSAKLYVSGVFLGSILANILESATSHGVVEFVEDGTFNVPSGVSSLNVTIVPSGGGGAGGSYNYGGGGGNVGGEVNSIVSVTPGETLNITIGLGGKPGLGFIDSITAQCQGGQGSITKIDNTTGILISSQGGTGGIVKTTLGNGLPGKSSSMGVGGRAGLTGIATYDPVSGAQTTYLPPSVGGDGSGAGAGGGGGAASALPLVDGVVGSEGGTGSKGWLRLTY